MRVSFGKRVFDVEQQLLHSQVCGDARTQSQQPVHRRAVVSSSTNNDVFITGIFEQANVQRHDERDEQEGLVITGELAQARLSFRINGE